MYRYAMIGVSAFSDPAHFPNDDNSDSSDLSGRPRQNFDNFLHAALCVFQVCLPLSISLIPLSYLSPSISFSPALLMFYFAFRY